jgi:hypothetical protein
MVSPSSYYAPYDQYPEFDRGFYDWNKVTNKVIKRGLAMKFLKSNQSRHYGVMAEGGGFPSI